MNGHQWLERATRDLPAGVAGRVERETRAHLQDAGLPDGADVRAVLGDPQTTNDGLRRLYLTRKEWEELGTGGPLRTGLNLTEWLVGLGFPLLLLVEVLRDASVMAGLALAALLAILALTWDLHSVRRRQWRLWCFIVIFAVMQWVPDLLARAEWTHGATWLWGVLGLALTLGGVRRWQHDARLRRTLLAEEGRA